VCEIVTATSQQQIEQVRSLFAEYDAQLPVASRLAALDPETAVLPGEYSPPAGFLLLATVVGQPVGCVGLRPFPAEGTCEMMRLYVRPAFRGEHLGEALVTRLLREARALNYTILRISTHRHSMAAATEIFRKFGFRAVPCDPLEPHEELEFMELFLESVVPRHRG
jgi:N-acetylglutamate synthase-like GNAT family acetyltransferase